MSVNQFHSEVPMRVSLMICLIAACLLPAHGNTASPEVSKYRQLHQLTIGRLTLSKVHVSLIAVKQKRMILKGSRKFRLRQLDQAHVVLKSSSGPSDFIFWRPRRGIGKNDPAAVINGRFHWTEGQIDRAELSELKLRLKTISVVSPLSGAELVVSPTTTVLVKNDKPISNIEV